MTNKAALYLHRSGVPLDVADLTVPDAPEHPLFGQGIRLVTLLVVGLNRFTFRKRESSI
ncbi:MAG: hypothetical protein IPL32_19870 [Chloracidobacterium sp.]|nr:hypothetical protein [Chloracidobacterium sp.]